MPKRMCFYVQLRDNKSKLSLFRHTKFAARQFVLFFVLMTATIFSYAQSLELIKDINVKKNVLPGSMSRDNIVFSDVVYFGGPEELWRTDATIPSTYSIKDENGFPVLDPKNFTVSGDNLYFVAQANSSLEIGIAENNSRSNHILWRISKHQPDVASPVLDRRNQPVLPGTSNLMADLDSTLIFSTNYSDRALTLWKVNDRGLAEKLKFIYPNDRHAVIDMQVALGSVYFITSLNELWRTDGTVAGTVKVADTDGIPYSSYSRDQNNMTEFNGKLFFTISTHYPRETNQLWRSDGTEAGTVQLKKYSDEQNFYDFGILNDQLVYIRTKYNYSNSPGFTQINAIDAITDEISLIKHFPYGYHEVGYLADKLIVSMFSFDNHEQKHTWVSDGTRQGTEEISTDIELDQYASFTRAGDELFFPGRSQSAGTDEVELWKTDGTSGGTVRVKDIAYQQNSSDPEHLIAFNNGILFQANKGDHLNGKEIWFSDGTDSGTSAVIDLARHTYGSRPQDMIRMGDNIFFYGNKSYSRNGLYDRWSLWRTDGTQKGTLEALDIIEGPRSIGREFAQGEIVELNDRLYFLGNVMGYNSPGLYSTDGRSGDLLRHDDQLPAANCNQFLHDLTVFKGDLYFLEYCRNNYDATNTIWKLDGDTQKLSRAYRDSFPIFAVNLIVLNDQLLFSGLNELWRIDSVSDKTAIATLEQIDGKTPNIISVEKFGNERLLIRAGWGSDYDGSYLYYGSWLSDGTPHGTLRLNEGSYFFRNFPEVATNNGSAIFYVSRSDANEINLWAADTNLSQKERLTTIDNSRNSRRASWQLVGVGHLVYFRNQDQLWRSDGTAQGTQPVSLTLFEQVTMLEINGELFFSAQEYDPVENVTSPMALYKSDGASITRIRGNLELVSEQSEMPVDDVFLAKTYGHYYQFWQTDGTASGTAPMFDTFSLSEPGESLLVENKLYISLNVDQYGYEPWLLDFGDIEPPVSAKLDIVKHINHRVRDVKANAAQLLANTLYRADYAVTNNLSDKVYNVEVFEAADKVCMLYTLSPGETKKCASNQPVLISDQNAVARVTAKYVNSSQTVGGETNAFYKGYESAPSLSITHYMNNTNADTEPQAVTVDSNKAEVLFRVENTGDVEIYRVRLYHDPVSPEKTGWQELCYTGALLPGQVRHCKSEVSITGSGLNLAFGRAVGFGTNIGREARTTASNPSYFLTP